MLTSSGISRVAAILAAGRAVSNVGGGTNAFVEATAKLSMLLPVYFRLSVVRPPRRLAADGAEQHGDAQRAPERAEAGAVAAEVADAPRAARAGRV